jgi:dynein heavy chain
MSSLGSEKVRWHELSDKYKEDEKRLDRKIFMASGQIIYFGAFTQAFRTRILKEWLPEFSEHKLKL